MAPGAEAAPAAAIGSGLRRRQAWARPGSGRARACLWGAAAGLCLLGGVAFLDAAAPGPITHMMAAHILLMNAVAPLVALAIAGRAASLVPAVRSAASLGAATVLQLALIGALHVPGAIAAALADPIVHFLMQGALLAAALWFWLAVLATRAGQRWRSLLALAVTAKLFCLLGALFVFAPRLLVAGLDSAHTPHGTEASLADQQLAGLLMLAACPLTYVLAGIVLAATWLVELSAGGAQGDRRDPVAAMRLG